MSINEVLTLIFALYGAGLATFLGIRELVKERRRIRILLQYVGWGEVYILRIVNIGQRPITIQSVSMFVKNTHKEVGISNYEPIQDGFVFSMESAKNLPVKLEDGESVELLFSELVQGMLQRNKGDFNLRVYDIEGNCYSKVEKIYFDAKYNYFTPLSDSRPKQRRFLGINLPTRKK